MKTASHYRAVRLGVSGAIGQNVSLVVQSRCTIRSVGPTTPHILQMDPIFCNAQALPLDCDKSLGTRIWGNDPFNNNVSSQRYDLSPVTSGQLHSSHATIMAWGQLQEVGEHTLGHQIRLRV